MPAPQGHVIDEVDETDVCPHCVGKDPEDDCPFCNPEPVSVIPKGKLKCANGPHYRTALHLSGLCGDCEAERVRDKEAEEDRAKAALARAS